jgi:hypothetical protein
MPQQRLEILYLTSHDSPDLEAYQGRGLDGLMIRLGQGGSLKDRTGKLDPYIDVGFPIHRASALVLGLPYGVVYQCASLTEEDAEVEGDWLLRQLSAIKEEIGLHVVLQIEDLPHYSRYTALHHVKRNEAILRIIAGKLVLEGFRVLIYATERSLEKSLSKDILKTYGAYVVRHAVTERLAKSLKGVKTVVWEYGKSILGDNVGAVYYDTPKRVALKLPRPATGDAVVLLPGTKVYMRAKDGIPCSKLGTKLRRFVWSGKKVNGKYAITLLAQFAEKPNRITCYILEKDIQMGILRERVGA